MIILYAVFQNTLKSWVAQFNEESSETLKRAKWVGIWGSASLFVWIGSIFLSALLQLFLIGALGVGASLFFWKPYDTALKDKKELDIILKEQENKDKVGQLKQIKLNKEKTTL